MIPGEVGVFCLGVMWAVTQGFAIPYLLHRRRPCARIGRTAPADRPTGYDTMRVRPCAEVRLTIGAEPTHTDHTRLDLAA